ncbi:MAG: amidohydrolase [Candidatus Bathyarchaeales archaeon]
MDGCLLKADLVLVNGHVLTMNPSKPYAEAVAIKKDKIVKVGRKEEISPLIGKKTVIVDLKGKSVIPGLIDAHIHVADFGKILNWVNLNDAKSIRELQDRIKPHSERTPKGKWIIGYGWDEANFMEKRSPNVKDLDIAVPENPVVLYRRQGRVCVVNTKALELAGITRETVPPQGGEIEKDPQTGEPTGILRENATDLVWKIIPEPTEEEIIENVKLAFKKILEAGITNVHWIVLSPSEIAIIRKLCTKNELPIRVHLIIPITFLKDLENLKAELKGKVKLQGVIIFADGSLASRTAALSSPYKDRPTTKGNLFYTQKQLMKLIAEICKNSLQPVIHAMGDQAINLALNAIEETLDETDRKNLRPRIEQAAVLNTDLIRRMRLLEVTASVQPYLIFSEFSVWSAMEGLGIERARWLYPLKTLITEGVIMCGGSDCPMEPLNPFLHIKAAVARQSFLEEQITVDEALRMYTVNAAYASFEEDIKGSIEEGKLADLTVLSQDPLKIPPNQIDRIKVEMTIVGGKVAYSSSPFIKK